MNSSEGAQLIEAMLDSMRRNPAQFHFNVNVTPVGAMGVGGPGGHGIVGIANGPGVGVYASASSPSAIQIQVTEQSANQQLNTQFQAIQHTLEAIVQDLKAQAMSAEKRDGFVGQLKTTWLPNVLVTLVASILTAVIGK